MLLKSTPINPDKLASATTFGVIDIASQLLRKNIVSITMEIAAHCDGAIEDDKRGFNKFDAKIGKRIARMRAIPSNWDSYQLTRWCRRLFTYRKQIRGDFLHRLYVGESNDQ